MSDQQNTAETVFHAALQLAPDKRAAYLALVCEGDDELRGRIELLLKASASAEPFFRKDPLRVALGEGPQEKGTLVQAPCLEQPGDRIGRYRLLEKVGEGGCGVVYVAEQTEPIRRRVALKVIKLGMDTKGVIARFEAERQALALMDHPNIAKVLDAGATGDALRSAGCQPAVSPTASRQGDAEDLSADSSADPQAGSLRYEAVIRAGRPYFVMELVRGMKITDYCDQNQLSTQERLDLFVQVCHAIQHAHQKGIIHRDIKPSNILVTLHDGVPVPKVIDFGIAKATEGRLTDATVYTQLHQFVGTPAYMSPEQAEMSGLDIDTRSDIYSLGVLLYELLTGKTPFDAHELMAQGIDAMRRTIREQEPVRPSTRLTHELVAADVSPHEPSSELPIRSEAEVSADSRRRLRLKEQIKLVRGDLDWIAMKSLEKDRTRRYETANGLAADIQRYLEHEPVLARPPSAVYRLRKAFRRHKLAFAAVGAVFLALLVGLLATSWQAMIARQARQLAEAHAYAGDMNLAQQALLVGELGKARLLLSRYQPGSGKEHLRGFEWRYLAAEARDDFVAADRSSADWVFSLALSPDGKTLAVSRVRKAVELWDAATLKPTQKLEATEGWVAVAFSPIGNRLAAASPSGRICLWELDPPRIVEELPSANDVACLDFSPDGRHLAAFLIRGDGAVIWDLETRRVVWRLRGIFSMDQHGGEVCFSPDGRHLAVGDRSGHIRIVDWAADRVVENIPAHDQAVTSLAYAPDGSLLVSGSGYSPDAIRLWDPLTGESLGTLPGHRGSIYGLCFSKDGRQLFSASGDQTIGVWDMATRRRLRSLGGHLDEVNCVAFDGVRTNLLSGSKDGMLARWDLEESRRPASLLTLPVKFRRPMFCDRGSSVAVLHEGAVALWRREDSQRLAAIPALGTTNYTLACAPSRGLLACAPLVEGPVRVWSLESNTLVTNLTEHILGHCRLLFSTSGSVLLAVDVYGRITLWNTSDWSMRRSCHERNLLRSFVRSEAVSPDSRLLVLGSADGRLFWWDAVRGERLEETPSGHRESIDGLAFSPDGRTVASAGDDGTVALWDARTRRCTARWRAFFSGIHSATFSPDGTRLATGLTGGGAVRLWDVKTQRELITLTAPGSVFGWTEFSPDGNALLAGSGNGYSCLWRVPPAEEVARWSVEDPAVVKYLEDLQGKRGAEGQQQLNDRARDEGAIKQWLVLAPIALATRQTGGQGLDAEQVPGEGSLRPSAGEPTVTASGERIWQKVVREDYFLDFNLISRRVAPRSVAYAVCYLRSETEQRGLRMRVGSDDQAKVYLNGEQVYHHPTSTAWIEDRDIVPDLTLQAGLNVLVFKVVNEASGWQGSIRFTDAQGDPVKGITVTLDPEE